MKTQLALYIFVFVFTLATCCVVGAADTDQATSQSIESQAAARVTMDTGQTVADQATNVDQTLISQSTVEIGQNTVNQAVADTDQVMVDTSQTAAGDDSQPYNTNIDFDEGELIGLEHNTEDDQLELSESFKIVPAFIWVPNSNEGTVSKVDTRTSLELARYRTSPLSYANPSRTTVDLDGNCWVGNRNTGTAVKIGLYENEQYIDRNGNGIIETCQDLDGNGVITPNEVLPWGQDECVLYEIVLIPKKEGTYVPGEYEGTYTNDYWNPGPRGIAVDSKNNVWIGCYGTMKYYYIDGSTGEILKTVDVSSVGHTPYGTVIDQNGILWSSSGSGNHVLRLDPSDDSFSRINLGHCVYGLALDRNNHLFVTGWTNSKLSRIDTLTGKVEWTKPGVYESRGVVVTEDGDVWTANSHSGTVSRFSNDGTLKATILVGNTPTGVSVDNQGKIWVVDNGDEYIHRIDPAINGVEISKRIIGGTHYGYSDMTGAVSGAITTRRGTWIVTHDSELENAPWGIISWNGFEPEGTSIKVKVRSSNDQQNWSAWEDAINGSQLGSTPPGRYLQIETTLQMLQANEPPVLHNLALKALVADLSSNVKSDNPSPQLGENVKLTIEVKNNGPISATGVQVNYKLPRGLEFAGASQSTYDPAEGIWNLGDLAEGYTTTLEITAKVQNVGSILNMVTARGEEVDPKTTNNISVLIINTGSQDQMPEDPGTGSGTGTSPNEPEPTPNIPEQVNVPETEDSEDGTVTSPTESSTSPETNPGNPQQPTDPYPDDPDVPDNSKPPKTNNSSTKENTVPMQNTGMPFDFLAIAVLWVFLGVFAQKSRILRNRPLLLLLMFIFTLIICGAVGAADPGQITVDAAAGQVTESLSVSDNNQATVSQSTTDNNQATSDTGQIITDINPTETSQPTETSIAALGQFAENACHTYTTDADFDSGELVNLEHDTVSDQLQLSEYETVLPYIWVPNSNEGTLSKVDTKTGMELARYRTSPLNDARPSRTAIDQEGNCWVGNMQTGTVVKIGLSEYLDKNGNGIIETSQDFDGNGVVVGTEILPWGQDERVLYEVVLIPGSEGTYTPGEYKGTYANNWSNPGPLAMAVDAQNNLWIGTYGTMKYYQIEGSSGQILKMVDVSTTGHKPQGAVIDQNGILWSAGAEGNILRLDPSTSSMTIINPGYPVYNLALDGDNHLFLYGAKQTWWSREGKLSRINILTGTLEWTKNVAYSTSGGIAVAGDGDVWLSEYYSSWGSRVDLVNRYSHDGEFKASMLPGYAPTGLSVDGEGKVWVVDAGDEYIHRIDPAMNGVDFSKRIVYGTHEGHSSMIGGVSKITAREGTWTVVHDSELENASWGVISWNSLEPEGTKIEVKVRSSNDKNSWSAWEKASNGSFLDLTPPGRYLQVQAILQTMQKDTSPILYDLTVKRALASSTKQADLIMAISTDNPTPILGDNLKMFLQAANSGPEDATGVKVNYQLPSNLEFLASPDDYDPASGLWDIGNLPWGAVASMEIAAKAQKAGQAVNTATIMGNEADPNTENNTASLSIQVRSPSSGGSGGLPPVNPPVNPPIPPENPPINPVNPPVPPVNPPNPNPPLPPEPTPPDNPPLPPTPPNPNPPIPPNPNPPAEPQKPSTQLGRDIAGVRQAVSQGVLDESVIPDWNLPPSGSEVEVDDDGIPWWVYAAVVLGAVLAVLLYKHASALSEYLVTVLQGFLNAIGTLFIELSYFGISTQKALESLFISLSIKYGVYITALLPEFLTIPIVGIDAATGISIALGILSVYFPSLAPELAPFISVLQQYTMYQISQKFNEWFGKK